MSETLELAVCLYTNLTTLDYLGPTELFTFLSSKFSGAPLASVKFNITFLAHTTEPVVPQSGPRALADDTYANVLDAERQFDIVLVPGGECFLPYMHAYFNYCVTWDLVSEDR
jgi:putative intracellular protease/amidase